MVQGRKKKPDLFLKDEYSTGFYRDLNTQVFAGVQTLSFHMALSLSFSTFRQI